jgi:hypothetical protein
MAEEATEAPEETQDTPDESGPESQEETATPATQEPEINYEQRYNDLRSEFDRRNQAFAALEGRLGPQAQAQALNAFGFDMDDEDDFEERDNESEEDRVARLEQWAASQQEREQFESLQAQEADYLTSEIEAIEKAEKRELSDQEIDLIANLAYSQRTETGEPDVRGAYQALVGYGKSQREAYVESKKAPKAPIGSPGDEQIDTSDDQKRQEAMARMMAAHMEES